MVFLGPLSAAADWVGTQLGEADGVLGLAAFSTIFKTAGIVVFFPFIDRFSGLLTRMVPGADSETAMRHLEPAVAAAGAPVALEAAWRATLEAARGPVDATRRALAGEPVKIEPTGASVQQIDGFLESLSIETTDLATFGPRLVRLTHALDHLTQLNEDLARIPLRAADQELPAEVREGALALATWFEATADPEAGPDPAVYGALEDASGALSAAAAVGREQALEDLALRRVPAATARATLATLAWSEGALHHAWRLAESLRASSGG